MDPRPDAPAHIWTAPANPTYTIALHNNTGKATTATLTFKTTSYDGKETTTLPTQTVSLAAADETATVKVAWLHPHPLRASRVHHRLHR